MKSLMILWREVAGDLATASCTDVTLDFKKLQRRVESEGLSFMTITLPQFGRNFDQALERGSVGDDHFVGFQRRGGLPLFLGGFLRRIFNTDGVLLDEPCIDSIFAIRQLTLMFAKIEIPCSEERVSRAIQGYIECEQELKAAESNTSAEMLSQFQRIGSLLWDECFTAVDSDVYYHSLIPRHGPGSTADGLLGNQKFSLSEWPMRMERIFPYGEYALPSWRYNYQLDHVNFLEPGAERPVKVITVPKTLKTPRIIAVEPTCMQYMQQAVAQRLMEEVEYRWARRITDKPDQVFNLVGFQDQSVNRLMAQEGSITGNLATLDLSEASDRVLNSHVELLFARWPHLNAAIQATRSTKASVPAGKDGKRITINLRKFASMGSALCFPVEALVFTTIVFCAVEQALNTSLTKAHVRSYLGKIRVYGDDIIVPKDLVQTVIHYLEAFGLKVNSDKSFWNGKFRESCGGDYYDGSWVTPVRVRRNFPRSRRDVPEVVSLVALRNQLYWAGLWRATRYLDDRIREILGESHFPIVQSTAPGLGRESVLPYKADKIHDHVHNPLVKGWRTVSVPPASELDGIGALLKCLLKQGPTPFADPRHLERQGRPRAVRLKRGWMQPF